jgi:hypothetical protein
LAGCTGATNRPSRGSTAALASSPSAERATASAESSEASSAASSRARVSLLTWRADAVSNDHLKSSGSSARWLFSRQARKASACGRPLASTSAIRLGVAASTTS